MSEPLAPGTLIRCGFGHLWVRVHRDPETGASTRQPWLSVDRGYRATWKGLPTPAVTIFNPEERP